MSTWRRKAIDCLPGCRHEFEQPDATIGEVFIELLPATVKAHKEKNTDRLTKFYAFAAWCMRQKEKELWNVAGVSFYEHLGDYEETFTAMPGWITKDIYHQIRGLLEWRLSSEKFQLLEQMMDYK
jgi:hypothetical protein